MTQRMVWKTGTFEIYVYGKDADACWTELGKLLRGECEQWGAEWNIEDAPTVAVLDFADKED